MQWSCAHVWFLWLLVPCSSVNQQCLLLTGTREKFAQRTHQLGRRLRVQVRRKGVAGTILPEGKGVEGAACHPETAQTLAYMLAQDPTVISASQTRHWHTTHMMTLKSPWASGTA